MKSVIAALAATVVATLVACKTPNPDACCTTTEDCKAFGLDDLQPCDNGLTCVGHQCVAPQCSTEGCAATAPVCDTTSDTCTGCDDSADCSRFAGTDVCDPATGACVECVTPSDCGSAKPICDASACRGCKLDSECASGACGDDGACVGEADVLFLSPVGADVGACRRSAPCKRISYAASQTTVTRAHIVMSSGNYGYGQGDTVDGPTTMATHLFVHGGGAAISTSGDGIGLNVPVTATIRNLELVGGGGGVIAQGPGAMTLEHVKVHGANYGLAIETQTTVRDLDVKDCLNGILVGPGGRLTLDRAVIMRGIQGISVSDAGASIEVTNTLVAEVSGLAFDLSRSAGGTVAFTTVANSGADAGQGPRAFGCSLNTVVRSSIIWAPGTVARAPIDSSCSIQSTIAGPTAVAGTANVDPQFVNAAAHDYHIQATSPARDAVEIGPTTDFEGDPRPRGARFDIGADEAP